MDDIFKMLKERKCQPRSLYPAKLSFRHKGKIKILPNKQNMTCSPLHLPYKICLKKFFKWKWKDTNQYHGHMKISYKMLKISIYSGSEYTNAVIWWCVNNLTLVYRLKDKSIKIATTTTICY